MNGHLGIKRVTAGVLLLLTALALGSGNLSLGAVFGMGSVLFLTEVLLHRRLQRELGAHHRRMESLLAIYSVLKPVVPLPPMREFAASPDLARTLMCLCHERRPKLVLELGSGVSTVIMAYCLRALGEGGHIVSLDQEAHFAQETRDMLALHMLADVATVLHAPLRATEIDGRTWQWYDLSVLEPLSPGPADLLVVDGPPGHEQPMARYPALPKLLGRLAPRVVVVLDDAARRDENRIVAQWMSEQRDFTVERLSAEKGIAVMRRG